MAEGYKDSKKLTVPFAPAAPDKGDQYTAETSEMKIVQEYTGFDFDRVDELDVFTFWGLLRDAVIYSCKQSEAGREYLEKCWLYEQTEPDRAALRGRSGRR